MALKTWHRAGLLASVLTLVAIIMLPPRPMPDPDDLMTTLLFRGFFQWGYPRVRHRYTLDQTAADLRNRHRAVVMADSLRVLMNGPRSVRSADGALTVIYERPLTADSARVWLAMLERELALMPEGTGRGMPIVVALRSDLHADRPTGDRVVALDGASWSASWVAMRFVSSRQGQPTCFAALRLLRMSDRENFSPSELIQRDHRTGVARTAALDWCMVYGRFGVPGALVSRWAGRPLEVRRWWAPGNNLSWALESARSGRVRSDFTPTMSPSENEAYWADPLNSACVRGARVPCLKSVGLLRDPSLRDDSFWIARVRGAVLVGLILKDPVRFERFWRSSEAPDIALEHAYGKPASDIIADWKRSIMDVPTAGPRAEIPALLSSLGWAAAVLAVGLVLAMRRQVAS